VIRVKQTKLWQADGAHAGNCLVACLASLLEIPLWMVPPFDEMFGAFAIINRVNQWLDQFANLEMVQLEGHQLDKLPTFYIASGQSPRGILHATIYSGGQLVHDPHPSDGGLSTVEFTRHLQKIIPDSASHQAGDDR
jgi:hypothetical protein